MRHWHAGMIDPRNGEKHIFGTGPESYVRYSWGGRFIAYWECDTDHQKEMLENHDWRDDQHVSIR